MTPFSELFKKFIFLLIMGIFIFPSLQKNLNLVSERSLKGAIPPVETCSFSFHTWFSGKYQDAYVNVYNAGLGFHNTLVRIGNQVNYDIFRLTNARSVVAGKKGYLFEDTYINSYLGKDYIGEPKIEKRLASIKTLQDALKKEKVDFILVFSPSKARFFPEYIPDQYHPLQPGISNYEVYTRLLEEKYSTIHFIDFNKYFRELKKDSRFPLYARGGTHWTNFASVTIALDSMVHFMESMKGIKMPRFTVKNMYRSFFPQSPDNDILETMNLLFPVTFELLTYATFSIENPGNAYRPAVLAISDSYYWNLFNSSLPEQVFSRNDFWFYNQSRYPSSRYENVNTTDYKVLRDDLLSHDFVILMVTEINLSNLFDFAEKTTFWLNPDDPVFKAQQKLKEERVDQLKETIRNDPQWLEMVRKKALDRGLTLEEMLQMDAEYLYQQETNKK